MSLEAAEAVVVVLQVYLAIGGICALPIAFLAAHRIDRAVSESTLGFRLIIVPGIVLLWPLMLRRMLAPGDLPPVERNAHRAPAVAMVDAEKTQAPGETHP